MTTYQHAQFLEAEQGPLQPGLDGDLAQRLQEERFPGTAGATHDQVLAMTDPLQGAQRRLGWWWNGRDALVPRGERLTGWERRLSAACGQRRTLAASNLFIQEQLEHFGRIPALRAGGG